MSVTPGPYTEDAAVEEPAIELFGELGWDHINAYHERLGPDGTLGRESRQEVFLTQRLRGALERLNPEAPSDAIDQAVAEITRERSALHYARANREVYELLRDRVPVSIRKPDGNRETERLTVIEWEDPASTTSSSSPSSGSRVTYTSGAPTFSASSMASRWSSSS